MRGLASQVPLAELNVPIYPIKLGAPSGPPQK